MWHYGMPMGPEPVRDASATIGACRAYVGARMHAPDRAPALLRSLRRRAHSDQQALDGFETLAAAAGDAGIAAASIESWLEDGDVEAALRADMAATRDPAPEALALAYKLWPSCEDRDRTCAKRAPARRRELHPERERRLLGRLTEDRERAARRPPAHLSVLAGLVDHFHGWRVRRQAARAPRRGPAWRRPWP